MMKTLVLEHPRLPSVRHFNDIANTPLWSCLMGGYVTAMLRSAGHHADYADAADTRWDFDRTLDDVMASRPDLLAVNAVYFWENTNALFDFLDTLRRKGFRGHINLFGFFPTLAYEKILSQKASVDSVAVGECEITLLELAGRLHTQNSWHSINGLACRDSNGRIILDPRVPVKSPDEFPFPVRFHGPDRTASILASRGCYNHCSFCPVPSFYNQGPLWRGRSPENIVSEIRELKHQGVKDFYFVDPNFVGPGRKGRKRAMDLAERLVPLNITFGMETRPNDLDLELLKAFKAAGLTSLLLGVESGSSKMLSALSKGTSENTSEKAITLCRQVGIEPEIGFLMFLPECRVDDIKSNFEFLRRNRLLDRLDRTANLLSHCQIVLMGTSGYREFSSQGRLSVGGIFGFQGKVDFSDSRVEWLSRITVNVCLDILREMSVPGSPISWTKGPCPAWTKVNDALVAMVNGWIETAGSEENLPDAGEIINKFTNRLCRGLAQALDGQEIGAERVKNRSI